MRKHPKKKGVAWSAMLIAAMATLAFAASAQAKLVGEFTKFQQCPWTTAGVTRCMYSATTGGETVLGNKKLTVEKEVIIQGGYTEPNFEEGNPEFLFAKFFAAKNGITLSKAAQNVPGGLLGIVPPESSPPLVKLLSAFFFENALTGVTATLELAKAATDIRVSENHLAEGEGIALKMPVRVHLENPFLGKNCYVGSSTTPIMFELTTGTTAPPGPNKPITGSVGEVEFLENARILQLKNAELVDNKWSAPVAAGCGGILSFLVNPIINTQVGLPAAAGKNTARLKNTIYTSTAAAVKKVDLENP
jgi:hypothetical protein